MTILTVGVFDLLHWGHFELFRKAKEAAGAEGALVVAVQVDEMVAHFKPNAELFYDFGTRKAMVEALRFVDRVIPYSSVDGLVPTVHFDALLLGEDQIHAGFQRAMDWCNRHGKQVIILPRTKGISTSRIKEGVRRQS